MIINAAVLIALNEFNAVRSRRRASTRLRAIGIRAMCQNIAAGLTSPSLIFWLIISYPSDFSAPPRRRPAAPSCGRNEMEPKREKIRCQSKTKRKLGARGGDVAHTRAPRTLCGRRRLMDNERVLDVGRSLPFHLV